MTKPYLRIRLRAHGMCRRCGYNRAQLITPRCPECGTAFDSEDEDMPTDDIHHDDELAMPSDPAVRSKCITCQMCSAPLPGMGDTGTCPACGTNFDRRERIFEIYGPEAFLGEAGMASPPRPASSKSWAPYRRAIIFSAVAVLSIPVAQYFVRIGAVGADRMPFVIFLFIIAIFEWIRVSGGEVPREGHDAGDDSDDTDSNVV